MMNDCKAWQRARRDDQKEAREKAILKAASSLFDDYRYEQITLALIAKTAGFTRSNLYRYFATKEDVYLRLMTQDFVEWYEKVEAKMTPGRVTPDTFVEQWLPLIMANKRLMRFYDLLASVFENNASAEALLEFKQKLQVQMQDVIALVLQLELFASAENAQRFMVSHLALISGMAAKLTMPESQRAPSSEQRFAEPAEFYEGLLKESIQALYDHYRQ